jgi:hypothetical protein
MRHGAGTARFGPGLDIPLRFGVLLGGILLAGAAVAADGLDIDDRGTALDAEIDDLFGAGEPADFAGLRESHFSRVAAWPLVKPLRPAKDQAVDTPWRWRAAGNDAGAEPLGPDPIAVRIAVPVAGDYRICLRQAVLASKRRPVTMTITPVGGASAADPPVRHVFGDFSLRSSVPAGQEEARLPVRFETEAQRLAFPGARTVLWEHWDVRLAAGEHELALAVPGGTAEVSAVFLSRSRSFRPSLAADPAEATLERLHVRYRILDQQPAGRPADISAQLGYHWRGRFPKGGGEPYWGWDGGGAKNVAAGEWSDFIDVAEAVLPGPGPWSTWRVRATGVTRGRLVAQFAWTPQDAAVMLELETALGPDGALFRFPNGGSFVDPAGERPAWGVWNAAHVATAMTQEAVIERYFAWADEAAARLGLPADHPRTKAIRLLTGCNVLPEHRERAAEMLARVGANWIAGAPESVVARHRLHDGGLLSNVGAGDWRGAAAALPPEQRQRIEKIKIGDEISTDTAAETVNADPVKLQRFHAYLRERMEAEGSDPESFLGVADFAELPCLGSLPEHPGRFERRLFYHSSRFRHLTTADDYRTATEALQAAFPRGLVYNNYSPHPLFLTGSDMNHVDWFVLCRNRAQSLGWGEDWASEGGWSLGTAYQIVSFYAALVECSVRRHGQPAGFYVGVNCGGAGQKIFSCAGRGLTWLELYAWGPIDGLAEGSNAWSEDQSQYFAVLTLLLGFHPGFTLRDSGGTRGPAREWLAAPLLARLGRPRVDIDHPAIEASLVEHDSGIAILLSAFGPVPEGERVLSVAAGRAVREVASSLHGPLDWVREGERITVRVPPVDRVDVIILR